MLNDEIKRLAPTFRMSSIVPKTLTTMRDKYIELLIKHPNLSPFAGRSQLKGILFRALSVRSGAVRVGERSAHEGRLT